MTNYWEKERDKVSMHAWEAWTENGKGLDDELVWQTFKTVQDAVTNSFVEDMDDLQWLDATMDRLKENL